MWLTLVGIVALAGFAVFIVEGLISFRLEKRHPSVIARFDAVSTPTSLQLRRFTLTGEHLRLGDVRLTRLVLIARTCGALAMNPMLLVAFSVWRAD